MNHEPAMSTTEALPVWTPARRWNETPVLTCLAALLLAALWAGMALHPSPPGDDSVAAGFARDMIVHHEQAVQMAEILRGRTNDPQLRLLATDIALTQQAQIGRMQGWLDAWRLPTTASEPAMAWMGTPTEGAMPGMATEDEIGRLQSAPIADAESLFLTLLIDHHRAGVDMAEAALDHDIPTPVRQLAKGIGASQQAEIDLMRDLLADRGYAPPLSGDAGEHQVHEASGGHHTAGLRFGSLFQWVLPAAGLVAVGWLAGDTLRRRRVWRGAGPGRLARPLHASVVAVASGAAGLFHLALTPAHLDESIAAGVLFAAGALAQLGLAGVVWAWPRRETLTAAASVAAVLIAIYFVFRVVPAPGADAAEDVDTVGLVVQGLQLAVLAAGGALHWERTRVPA